MGSFLTEIILALKEVMFLLLELVTFHGMLVIDCSLGHYYQEEFVICFKFFFFFNKYIYI